MTVARPFAEPVDTPLDVDRLAPWQLPRLWLAAAYLYEIESETLIPDNTWDHLCARLDLEWDAVAATDKTGHWKLIDRFALGTATAGYLSAADYPPLARGLAEYLLQAWRGRAAPYRIGLYAEPVQVPDVPDCSELLW